MYIVSFLFVSGIFTNILVSNINDNNIYIFKVLSENADNNAYAYVD